MHLPAAARAGVLLDLRAAASSLPASSFLGTASFAAPKEGRVIFHSSLEIGGADAVFFSALGSALVFALAPSCTRFLRFSRLSDVGCDVVLRQHKSYFESFTALDTSLPSASHVKAVPPSSSSVIATLKTPEVRKASSIAQGS